MLLVTHLSYYKFIKKNDMFYSILSFLCLIVSFLIRSPLSCLFVDMCTVFLKLFSDSVGSLSGCEVSPRGITL